MAQQPQAMSSCTANIDVCNLTANGYTEERVSILQLLDDKTFKAGWLEAFAKQTAEVKNLPSKDDILKKVEPSDLLVIFVFLLALALFDSLYCSV